MSGEPQGITEFLLARIAEDEAVWQTVMTYGRLDEHGLLWVNLSLGHGVAFDAAESLAQCEAKQQIVKEISETGWMGRHRILRLLALPYSDHPDYREEWRP